MEYVQLNNGVKMPLAGLGTFKMVSQKICTDSLAAAYEAGYRLVDTAQYYGNEEQLGRAIRESGINREELFLTTKAWFLSYDNCRDGVLASMKKLGTDYLDLILLHWPFGDVYTAWRDLEKLYEEGLVRAIGVANFSPARLMDLIRFHKIRPAVNQVEIHLFCQRQLELPWYAKYDAAPQAYAPLGQGKINEMFTQQAVLDAALHHGKTPAQIALRFLVQQGIVVIPKSSSPAHLKENIAIFDFTLTDAEMTALRQLDRADPIVGKPDNPVKAEAALSWPAVATN